MVLRRMPWSLIARKLLLRDYVLMDTIAPVLQVVTALGLMNVWVIRANWKTNYRGKNATNIREEFAVYGLPGWVCYVVGGLKIAAALCLLVGLWLHSLVVPAAAVVAVLMVGALTMHLKVKDPIKKFTPALLVLAMCLTICLCA